MHAITQLRIYSTTEEAGTPQKTQFVLIMAHTFKQGEKGKCLAHAGHVSGFPTLHS